MELMEKILSRENMLSALKAVKQNKGAAGIDKVTVDELDKIEKYFDTVNHDKLISILREKVNDAKTLHLIRGFLKAGVMENGVICQNDKEKLKNSKKHLILTKRYGKLFIPLKINR